MLQDARNAAADMMEAALQNTAEVIKELVEKQVVAQIKDTLGQALQPLAVLVTRYEVR